MECPYRGDPLIQVLQVDCAGDFQPIDLKDVFQVLEGSVQYEKDIVKEYASLKVIDDEQSLEKPLQQP